MGSINPQGVYIYDESDTAAKASDMLNKQGNALTSAAKGIKYLREGLGSFLTDSQTITLPEPIMDQPNGIVLIWSRYDDATSSVQDNNWVHTPIHKSIVPMPGSGVALMLPDLQYQDLGIKYVYVNADSISGHANNSSEMCRHFALRAIASW